MNDREYELFRDQVLDFASKCPMKKCPRCLGSGRRPNKAGSMTVCLVCDGKRKVSEEEYDNYMTKALFP